MKTSLTSTFDHLFNHNIKNHVENIIIYDTSDQWSVEQFIDEKDHIIWKELVSTGAEPSNSGLPPLPPPLG